MTSHATSQQKQHATQPNEPPSPHIETPIRPGAMYVVKRNGSKQAVSFDKVLERVQRLVDMQPALDNSAIDAALVAQKVIAGIFPGVSTSQLDLLAAETAVFMAAENVVYEDLATRILVSNLHKNTNKNFVKTVQTLFEYVNPKNDKPAALVSAQLFTFVQRNGEKLQAMLDYSRDYSTFNYFGWKTLEKSYLLKCHGKIVERPQHMLMRVALGIHAPRTGGACSAAENVAALADIAETYDYLSRGFFVHATPTLFNAGTPKPQMSSCFLVKMSADSIEGIYDTLKRCALISKSAGGIGVSVSNIRATDSYIAGTNGASNGLVPMLRVYNDTARYVDQGGGRRKGAFAVYLEPWHADIFDFLDLKKNHGKEERRARDLFYGLWIPDLFMQRVESGGKWSLFCPNEAPGLQDVHSDEFVALYEKYESEGRARKTVPAQALWRAIVDSQIETGTPYMLYKDSANRKSNQQNLGTITSSNLCTEIIEYTAADEVAVCNLASLALPKYVCSANDGTSYFDHSMLEEVVRVATRNLNKIIDGNYYPVEEARKSNMRHRPIGLGVQGLADVFFILKMPFESAAAHKLNREIFETIYYAALSESVALAKANGRPYETFAGSPLSEGKLQFDLWQQKPESERPGADARYDWAALRAQVQQYGAMNSLLVAPMPTASTAQILGNYECFEPPTNNLFTRRVLAGEFVVTNKHLVRDLTALGLWTRDVRTQLVRNKGSVQNIAEIPHDIKQLYKTVWEIPQRALIDMSADRGIYVDQSQSFNVHMREATFAKVTSMHFYGWKKGLKSGVYYLRTQAAADAIQFTVEKDKPEKEEAKGEVCRMQDGCISCGS